MKDTVGTFSLEFEGARYFTSCDPANDTSDSLHIGVYKSTAIPIYGPKNKFNKLLMRLGFKYKTKIVDYTYLIEVVK